MLPDGEADFRKLLEMHAAVMYRQALRMLGNHEDAEDAVQDAFLRIWKHRRSFAHRSRLSTWIFRITHNASAAIRERRRASDVAGTRLSIDPGDPHGLQPEARPEHHSEGDMARLLALLPALQASALSLFYVEGLGYKEIADVLQIPPGSVATAIHRGKERLRDILRHHEGDFHGRV